MKEKNLLGWLDALSATVIILGVNLNPLKSSVWADKFAVVVSLHLDLPVVDRCHHCWRSKQGFCLVVVVLVRQVIPDPQWPGVVGSQVVSNHKLLALRVVIGDGIFVGVLESPIESLLVDLLAEVEVVVEVKTGIGVSSVPLNLLTRDHLCLLLDGSLWATSNVEISKSLVVVFGYGKASEVARFGVCLSAGVVDLWQVMRGGYVNSVEVVLSLVANLLISGVSSKGNLSLMNPRRTLHALFRGVWVHKVFVVARNLNVVAALEEHSINEWLEEHVGFILEVT